MPSHRGVVSFYALQSRSLCAMNVTLFSGPCVGGAGEEGERALPWVTHAHIRLVRYHDTIYPCSMAGIKNELCDALCPSFVAPSSNSQHTQVVLVSRHTTHCDTCPPLAHAPQNTSSDAFRKLRVELFDGEVRLLVHSVASTALTRRRPRRFSVRAKLHHHHVPRIAHMHASASQRVHAVCAVGGGAQRPNQTCS